MNAKRHNGIFESVSDVGIVIRDAAGESSVPRQSVRSVRLIKNNRRLRHSLIGLGVGAGAGAGIGAGIWESDGFLGGKGTGAAVGAGIGAVSGLVVGALLPVGSTIYQVPPR